MENEVNTQNNKKMEIKNPNATNELPVASPVGKIAWYGSFILLLPLVIHVLIRNSFVKSQAKINELSSDIDVQLKNRRDTLIKLVDATKSYIKYEKTVLQDVTKLRKMNLSDNYGKADSHMNSMFGKIVAVGENYPNLKADESVNKLMEQAAYLEQEIAASRRLYNSQVQWFNATIFTWPNVIIAESMHLSKQPFFEATTQDKEDVSTKLF